MLKAKDLPLFNHNGRAPDGHDNINKYNYFYEKKI